MRTVRAVSSKRTHLHRKGAFAMLRKIRNQQAFGIGVGLVGLIALGSCTITPEGGGFRVEAWIPLEGPTS